MRFLAGYASRGRWQALTVTVVSALLSPLFAPLIFLSGATVALITLKIGVLQGLQLAGLAALVVWLIGLLMPASPEPAVMVGLLVLLVWLPAWLLAIDLRRTANQGRLALWVTVFGCVLVFALHAWLENPTAWWEQALQHYFSPVSEQLTATEQLALQESLQQMAAMMTGMVAAVAALGVLASVLLARWWQALLLNPGGFGKEFRALQLGRTAAGIVLAVVVLSLLSDSTGLSGDLLLVALLPFLVQGTALMHAWVAIRGLGRGWLVLLYVLLLFAGPVALLLAAVGALDNWFNFRAYAAPSKGQNDS